ncbi:class I SAM-dependent methyltransferase [Sulfurisphaera ohwakuensis]|uniref:Methyltransferase domain-containing protein n=1 Tax=Sulfurisphaera ohwakuensis TaxID=69656 RepID=A0A650CGH1_SULOH|nr:class I SAM-dependent methyltransferase [Sulfurisphaera ohwakuensis]MBB5255265.1 ubiquinone/menaquinone biosynthesis C-methylase UbiE [Sulfurisphaera ohwakuensis]QGR16637.1 methyltransferase domain-containing protein [Sulfurisphaera ohwakuensis]
MVETEVNDRHIPPFILSSPLRRLFENPYSLLRKFIVEGMVVVDHGSGPGYYTIPMAKLVGEKGIVYAVDSDPKTISYLEKKLKKLGINNVKTIVSRNLSPIRTESVDFLISKDVLCCTVLHKELAKDIERVLKKGGKAYVTVRLGRVNKDPRALSAEEFFSLFTLIKEKGKRWLSAWVILEKPKTS